MDLVPSLRPGQCHKFSRKSIFQRMLRARLLDILLVILGLGACYSLQQQRVERTGKWLEEAI